jgi:carboxypeptidase C (cathepsin A)
MGSFSDFLENKVLDHCFRNTLYTQPATVYSKLFTVIPSDSTNGTEVTNASSGYTAVATTFITAASGQTSNASALTFATAAAAYTIVGYALSDTSTNATGNNMAWATVTTIAFVTGDQPTIALGGVVITLD